MVQFVVKPSCSPNPGISLRSSQLRFFAALYNMHAAERIGGFALLDGGYALADVLGRVRTIRTGPSTEIAGK